MNEIKIEWKLIIRGLAFLIIVKVGLFLFLASEHDESFDRMGYVVNDIAIKTTDSDTYFNPLENYVTTGKYSSLCRMPGFVPIYIPLRWCLSENDAQVAIVIVQLIFDIIASLLLAIIAARLFQSKRAFIITTLLYGVNVFIGVRSIFLMSDSFCVSLLVISFYYLSTYCITTKPKYLLVSGIFFAWAFLFRVPVILSLPAFGFVLLWRHRNLWQTTWKSAFFALPLILCLTAWTVRNVVYYDRFLILVPPVSECMGAYTEENEAMRTLIITMGEDFQRWSPNSAADWFWQKQTNYKTEYPFKENDFTSEYNLDSLIVLKESYTTFFASQDDIEKSTIGKTIMERSYRYADAYKNEHPVRFWIVNRINFIRMFIYPTRLDDVPLPPLHKMNILHKAVKGGGYLHFMFINLFGVIAMFFFWWKRNALLAAWSTAIVIPILFLSFIGFIEQRYSATAFPILTIFTSGLILYIIEWFEKRKQLAHQ